MKSNINVLLSFLTNFLKQSLLWWIEIFTGQDTNHRHWLTGENYEMTGNYRSPAIICSTGGEGGVHEKPIYREELPKKRGVTWIVGRFRGGGAWRKRGEWYFWGGLIPQCTLCMLWNNSLWVSNICACATRDCWLIHTAYIFPGILSNRNLHWGYSLINGAIDNIINVIILLFLEILSNVPLLTWNVNLHTRYEVKVCVANLVKWQCAVKRSTYYFKKSHVAKLIKSLSNFVHQRVSL